MKYFLLIIFMFFSTNMNSNVFLIKINKETNSAYFVDTSKIWNTSSSAFTEWINIDSPFDLSLYSPEITNQTENFDQTQTFNQNQQQLEQKREYEQSLNIYKDIGDPIIHLQTIMDNNIRNVNVVSEDWLLVGNLENCEEWSPTIYSMESGVEFTQSRQCEQERSRIIKYYIDTTLEKTISFNEIALVVENEQKTGSKNLRWVQTDSREHYYMERYTYEDEPDDRTIKVNFDYISYNTPNNPILGGYSYVWYNGEQIKINRNSCDIENNNLIYRTAQSRVVVVYNVNNSGTNYYRIYYIFEYYKCEEVSKYGITD